MSLEDQLVLQGWNCLDKERLYFQINKDTKATVTLNYNLVRKQLSWYSWIVDKYVTHNTSDIILIKKIVLIFGG